jgi:uncharacterized membrane protein YedE/YeeE
VWVVAVTLPLAWILDGAQLDAVARPNCPHDRRGLLFGVGAAINGGCSFGTLIRLGGGDASFVATFAGLAFGFLVQQHAPAVDLGPALLGPSPLEMLNGAAIAALWLRWRSASARLCATGDAKLRLTAGHPNAPQ